MPHGDGNDPAAKCRDRRRRRIEMRKSATISAAGSSYQVSNLDESATSPAEMKRTRKTEAKELSTQPSSSSSSGADAEAKTLPGDGSVGRGLASEPVYGTMSVSGRSREMEDAIDVRPALCRPEISGGQPVDFYAVYDGHGGAHVALLCKERMQAFVEEELRRVGDSVEENRGGVDGNELESVWKRVMKRSFERMDEVALKTCGCGSSVGNCACHPMEIAFGGSTAVVAMLTPDHIVVANCGDSRAVLCRGGRAVPLSSDHKPDRADELERIEAAGGRVIFVNGARVEGILAMSRAIGDKYLKPVVSSEPDVTLTKREPDDECLILASDGLWDVLSNDLACEIAHRCLREDTGEASSSKLDVNEGPRNKDDEEAGALYPSRSALAAALLTRLALGRKSSDNISVIVIDLKRGCSGEG